MSRFAHPIRHSQLAARWKLALPLAGLLLAVAPVHTEAARAQASPQRAAFDQRDAPYALVRDGEHGMSITGDGGDWPAIRQARKHVDGDFVWFREGGRAYVIQDPDTLAKARAAWAPVDRLGRQMDAYGREMDRHGKAMDALGRDMARAADGMQPDPTRMRALERQMDELGQKIGGLAEQMVSARDEERTDLNRQMARLSARMGELGREMGAAAGQDAQRRSQLSMNEVSLRMQEAGKPMNELGRKMDALGRDMERESQAADKTVRALIRDAAARGLARPAPQD